MALVWLIGVLTGIPVYYLVKFYWRVKRMPAGPTPLPVVGNAFALIGIKKHPIEMLMDVGRKYGPVFTFWAGHQPLVFITDIDLAGETFKKSEFSGRPNLIYTDFLTNQNRNTNILFSDCSPAWESLRRLAHAGVRKFSISDSLPCLIKEIVDETVIKLKDKAKIASKVNPSIDLHFMVTNIVFSSTFGHRLASIDSPDFKIVYHAFEFFKKVGIKIIFIQFMPFLKPFFKETIQQIKDVADEQVSWVMKRFEEKKSNYQQDVINNLGDALIAAREEAFAKGKDEADFLTDENLALAMFDLFMAGTETTFNTLIWIVLLLAEFPEMQVKMRQEIESVIGDRMPVQDDRNECHFVNAFVSETLRFRNATPVGLFHKTMCNTKIGKFEIPKETIVFLFNQNILSDPKLWPNFDPNEFVPERFLVDGEYVNKKPPGFIPFGFGRRACPGEKLALADLFLMTVNFLQTTTGYKISLPDGPGSVGLAPETEQSEPILIRPKDYEIVFRKTTN